MTGHKTGTRQDWLAARLELLEAEKELTPQRDWPWWCRHDEYDGQ